MLKYPCPYYSTVTTRIHTWQFLPPSGDTTRAHTQDTESETERVSCVSRWSLSWCCLTWSKQSSAFLHRYVKHQGWSVRLYLLPGLKAPWKPVVTMPPGQCQQKSARTRTKQKRMGWGWGWGEHTVFCLMYCIAAGNFSQLLIIYRSCTGLC